MAKAFSIMDIMSEVNRDEAATKEITEKVSVFDIQPNPKNEYELSEIEKIKDSIYTGRSSAESYPYEASGGGRI